MENAKLEKARKIGTDNATIMRTVLKNEDDIPRAIRGLTAKTPDRALLQSAVEMDRPSRRNRGDTATRVKFLDAAAELNEVAADTEDEDVHAGEDDDEAVFEPRIHVLHFSDDNGPLLDPYL